MQQTHPYIDLATLQLVMPAGKTILTGEEWQRTVWPPCPKCGTTVEVDRVELTLMADQFPRYVPGRWQCPNECDPTRG
ncbi:hypothetical protein [Thermomonospora amylolytica]|uniref:hypothetical protein n=1 Tax=Thermomonospora amylolytica TaxID=1411117 RepID=UPI000E6C3ED3|nr:hypothetical protein [Thermomonospora amylolytica]